MTTHPFLCVPTRASIRSFAAGALATAATMPFAAQAGDLRVGLSVGVTSMNPQWNGAGPDNAMALYIFELLVFLDKNDRYMSGLAASWKPVDTNTWEIKLRPNAKRSDGTPSTGEDVKVSIEHSTRLTNGPGPFMNYAKSITEVQIVDLLMVRLKLSTPSYVSVPDDLDSLPITPKKVTNAPQAGFDADRAMIGTGPLLFDHFAHGQEVVLKKGPHCQGCVPQWDKVTFEIITDNTARIAALLSGSVDVIETVPAAGVSRIRQDIRFHLGQQVSWRIIF